MTTFAEELNRLALTIFVITEENRRDIVKNLDIYFMEKVGALYWEIALSGANVKNMPGLETIAPESSKGTYHSLKRKNIKCYQEYRALAFSKDKPSWIVEKEGKELCHLKATLVDNWSNLHEDSEFPEKFPKDYCRPAKTALYYPLKFQKIIFGVFVKRCWLLGKTRKLLVDRFSTSLKNVCVSSTEMIKIISP
jgi:hypothetical protein